MLNAASLVEFDQETTYMSISATTGRPDFSGLTLAPGEVDLESLSMEPLQPVSRTVNRAGATPFHIPDSVHGPTTGGNTTDLLKGVIPMRGVLRGPGDAGVSAMPSARLGWALLATYLKRMDNPSQSSETLVADSASTSVVNVTSGAAYEIGRLLAWEQAGKIYVSRVVANDALQITISPPAPAVIPSGTVLRYMDTYYAVREGELGVPDGPSLGIRIKTPGAFGYDLAGCRAISYRIIPDDDGFVSWEADVEVGWGVKGTGATYTATHTDAGELANSSQKDLNINGVIGCRSASPLDAYPSSRPAAVTARTDLFNGSFSLDIQGSTSRRAQTNFAGRAEGTVGGHRDTTITLSDVYQGSVFRTAYRDRERYVLAVGAGPLYAGSGLGIVVPAAAPVRDFQEEYDEAELRFSELTFKPTAHGSDEGATDAGDSAFYIGCTLPTVLV